MTVTVTVSHLVPKFTVTVTVTVRVRVGVMVRVAVRARGMLRVRGRSSVGEGVILRFALWFSFGLGCCGG